MRRQGLIFMLAGMLLATVPAMLREHGEATHALVVSDVV